MRRRILMFIVLFLIGSSSSIAQGPVPGAVLWLDAAQSAGTGVWENLGTAGGVMPGGAMYSAGTPVLEPAGNGEPARYTAKKVGQVFGGPRGTTPVFRLGEEWTVELWVKRNGPAYGADPGGRKENQIAGFQAFPLEEVQSIRILLIGEDSSNVSLSGIARPGGQEVPYSGLHLGVNEWHRIVFVHTESDKRLRVYEDDQMINAFESDMQFDPKVDIEISTIFANSAFDIHRGGGIATAGEEERNFNGSIRIVRVYDRALSDAELMTNFRHDSAPSVAVESKVVDPEAQFTIDISTRLANNPLDHFRFDLAFEPGILQAIGIKMGSLFSDNSTKAATWQTPELDNEKGLITNIEYHRTGEENKAQAVGGLASVTFKAIEAGNSGISLQNLRLLPDGEEISTWTRDGSVDIYPHGSISGTVYAAQSKTPLARAKMEVSRDGFAFGLSTRSDRDGKYILNDVPAGKIDVTASKRLYADRTLQVDVTQGELTSNIDFEMELSLQWSGTETTARALLHQLAPELTLQDLNGNPVRLSDFNGRPVVLNFWASWSDPCRAMMPHLDALWKKYKTQGLIVIGVNDESDPEVARAFAIDNISYPVLLEGWPAFEAYGISSVPSICYIDGAGLLRYHDVGFSRGKESEIEKKIKQLLQ